jgi:hypothetical protein
LIGERQESFWNVTAPSRVKSHFPFSTLPIHAEGRSIPSVIRRKTTPEIAQENRYVFSDANPPQGGADRHRRALTFSYIDILVLSSSCLLPCVTTECILLLMLLTNKGLSS